MPTHKPMPRGAISRSTACFSIQRPGRLLDYVGGRRDLEAGLLRAIGDPGARFAEDALRLLRAARFGANLGFVIDPRTWSAVCESAGLIVSISAERVRDEIGKALTRRNPGRFVLLLEQSGLLAKVLPEVSALRGVEQPPEFHPEGDVLTHTIGVLENLPPAPSEMLAWSALLHDVGKPGTFVRADRIRFNAHHELGAEIADAIARRLAFPNALREPVGDMVRRHMRFLDVPHMRESTLRRFLAGPNMEDELRLHRADCLASHGDLSTYEQCQAKLDEMRSETNGSVLPEPLVRGRDLLALGVQPGPAFGQILAAVFDAQLEGKVEDHAGAIGLASRLAANHNHGGNR